MVDQMRPSAAKPIRCVFRLSIVMWLRTIFRRASTAIPIAPTALDEQLLRRLERLALAAARSLPGGLSGVHPRWKARTTESCWS